MRIITALVIFVFVVGCEPTLDISPQEVESSFNQSLKPGDGAEKIEKYFRNEGLVFSFDEFSGRYQSIIRHPDSNYHAITIHVYVDSGKNFVRVEANDSYTSL